MPLRVLGVRRANSLRLAETGDPPEWLLLRLRTRNVAAIPVLRRDGGLLLAVAGNALTEEEIQNGRVEGVIEQLGLVGRIECRAQVVGAEQEAEAVEVPMLLFDWPAAFYKHLRVRTGDDNPNWPADMVWPCHGEEANLVVDTAYLAEQAFNWVEAGELHCSDAYLTGLDGGALPWQPEPSTPSEDLLRQLLDQMQETAAAVTQLKGDVEAVKQSRGGQEAVAPSPSPQNALAQARQLVGPAPTTKAGSSAANPVPMPDFVDDEDAEGGVDMDTPTDQLMKMALVSLLSKASSKKKTKGTGLPLTQSGSDSEGEDALRKLSGARGTMLLERLKMAMEENPAAYSTAIETLAAQVLGESSPNASTMEKYVKDEMPLGHEKSLGYMVWCMTRALGCLRSGQTEKGRLVLLLGLAAVEQYRLDGRWEAAWKMTHLSQPPFADWKNRDPHLSQLRADNAHSRLVHPTWAAATIARMKDEEVLVKRRTRAEDRPNDRPPKGKGRGFGRGAETSEK